jgi:hypothetical protein
MQSIQDAKVMQTELKGELTGKVQALTAALTESDRRNQETHDKIFLELKEQRDTIFKTQLTILQEIRGQVWSP